MLFNAPGLELQAHQHAHVHAHHPGGGVAPRRRHGFSATCTSSPQRPSAAVSHPHRAWRGLSPSHFLKESRVARACWEGWSTYKPTQFRSVMVMCTTTSVTLYPSRLHASSPSTKTLDGRGSVQRCEPPVCSATSIRLYTHTLRCLCCATLLPSRTALAASGPQTLPG